jgi:D-threo-aldose 1-dehydrogenase
MLEITRMALGCAPIGGLYEAVSDEQAGATLDAAWGAGVRAFDTAPLYGLSAGERDAVRAGTATRF